MVNLEKLKEVTEQQLVLPWVLLVDDDQVFLQSVARDAEYVKLDINEEPSFRLFILAPQGRDAKSIQEEIREKILEIKSLYEEITLGLLILDENYSIANNVVHLTELDISTSGDNQSTANIMTYVIQGVVRETDLKLRESYQKKLPNFQNIELKPIDYDFIEDLLTETVLSKKPTGNEQLDDVDASNSISDGRISLDAIPFPSRLVDGKSTKIISSNALWHKDYQDRYFPENRGMDSTIPEMMEHSDSFPGLSAIENATEANPWRLTTTLLPDKAGYLQIAEKFKRDTLDESADIDQLWQQWWRYLSGSQLNLTNARLYRVHPVLDGEKETICLELICCEDSAFEDYKYKRMKLSEKQSKRLNEFCNEFKGDSPEREFDKNECYFWTIDNVCDKNDYGKTLLEKREDKQSKVSLLQLPVWRGTPDNIENMRYLLAADAYDDDSKRFIPINGDTLDRCKVTLLHFIKRLQRLHERKRLLAQGRFNRAVFKEEMQLPALVNQPKEYYQVLLKTMISVSGAYGGYLMQPTENLGGFAKSLRLTHKHFIVSKDRVSSDLSISAEDISYLNLLENAKFNIGEDFDFHIPTLLGYLRKQELAYNDLSFSSKKEELKNAYFNPHYVAFGTDLKTRDITKLISCFVRNTKSLLVLPIYSYPKSISYCKDNDDERKRKNRQVHAVLSLHAKKPYHFDHIRRKRLHYLSARYAIQLSMRQQLAATEGLEDGLVHAIKTHVNLIANNLPTKAKLGDKETYLLKRNQILLIQSRVMLLETISRGLLLHREKNQQDQFLIGEIINLKARFENGELVLHEFVRLFASGFALKKLRISMNEANSLQEERVYFLGTDQALEIVFAHIFENIHKYSEEDSIVLISLLHIKSGNTSFIQFKFSNKKSEKEIRENPSSHVTDGIGERINRFILDRLKGVYKTELDDNNNYITTVLWPVVVRSNDVSEEES